MPVTKKLKVLQEAGTSEKYPMSQKASSNLDNGPENISIDPDTGHLIISYRTQSFDAGTIIPSSSSITYIKFGEASIVGSKSAESQSSHAYCIQIKSASIGSSVIKFKSSAVQTKRIYLFDSSYNVVEYIDVNLTVGINIVNVDWNFIPGYYLGIDATTSFSYINGSGLTFIDLNTNLKTAVIQIGTIPLEVSFNSIISNNIFTNKFSYKNIFLYGDSISSTDYTWYQSNLSSKLNASVFLKGYSGYTASQLTNTTILNTLLNQSPDLIIILLGGNDNGSSGSVGTFFNTSNGESVVSEIPITGSYSGTKYIQAADYIIRYLKSGLYSAKKKIVVLNGLPQQRNNSSDAYSLTENNRRKVSAIEEVCLKNNIPCIDTYKLCNFYMPAEPYWVSPTNKTTNNGIFTMDGLHPNEYGFDVITDIIANFLSYLKV